VEVQRLRILQLHSNFIEVEVVKKEIALAEEHEKTEERFEELAVLFTAIEEGDNTDIARKAMENTKDSLDKLKVNKILIYPYAHLSNTLAKPADALKIIKELEKIAKKNGIALQQLVIYIMEWFLEERKKKAFQIKLK